MKILGVVNSEWLFGEFEGQKGRFPRAFVDHVPSGLPHFEDEQPQTIHDKVCVCKTLLRFNACNSSH